MNENFRLYIDRVHAYEGRYGDQSMPPATEADIVKLSKNSFAEFGEELPRQYLDFLRVSDGLNHDGLYIYGYL